ncbi:hypothetical protein OKW42_001450 [Paraburkholderia sp. WC7.3d]
MPSRLHLSGGGRIIIVDGRTDPAVPCRQPARFHGRSNQIRLAALRAPPVVLPGGCLRYSNFQTSFADRRLQALSRESMSLCISVQCGLGPGGRPTGRLQVEPGVVGAMICMRVVHDWRSELAFTESQKPGSSLHHIPRGGRHQLLVVNGQNLFENGGEFCTHLQNAGRLRSVTGLIKSSLRTPVQVERRITEACALQVVRQTDNPDQSM